MKRGVPVDVKASLNLSVNAVVILILAVTMLGLGLTFIKNIFGGAITDLDKVREDIRDRVIRDLRDSTDRLGFYQEDIKIKRSNTKEIYFGIKNEQQGPPTSFGIFMECTSQMSAGASGTQGLAPQEAINFEYFESSPEVTSGDVEVVKAIVSADPQADVTTYLCAADICEGPGGSTCASSYARKNFFVTTT